MAESRLWYWTSVPFTRSFCCRYNTLPSAVLDGDTGGVPWLAYILLAVSVTVFALFHDYAHGTETLDGMGGLSGACWLSCSDIFSAWRRTWTAFRNSGRVIRHLGTCLQVAEAAARHVQNQEIIENIEIVDLAVPCIEHPYPFGDRQRARANPFPECICPRRRKLNKHWPVEV